MIRAIETLLIVLPMLAIAGLVAYIGGTLPESEWHAVDGPSGERMWGRKIKGEWQYRPMTVEEYNEDVAIRCL